MCNFYLLPKSRTCTVIKILIRSLSLYSLCYSFWSFTTYLRRPSPLACPRRYAAIFATALEENQRHYPRDNPIINETRNREKHVARWIYELIHMRLNTDTWKSRRLDKHNKEDIVSAARHESSVLFPGKDTSIVLYFQYVFVFLEENSCQKECQDSMLLHY